MVLIPALKVIMKTTISLFILALLVGDSKVSPNSDEEETDSSSLKIRIQGEEEVIQITFYIDLILAMRYEGVFFIAQNSSGCKWP